MEFSEVKGQTEKLLKSKARLSGESYFEYAQKTASKLKKYGIKDETTLKLAYLHHIPRTSALYKSLIDGEAEKMLQKYEKFANTKISTDSLQKFNEKYLIQTCINLVEDVRPLTVRIAEKLVDLENSWVFAKQKREDIALRAMYLYAPLAKILGINALSKDLEDVAFKILFPMEYYTLKRLIEKKKWGTKKIFDDTEKVLKELLEEQGLSNFIINYRTKGIYSTYKKVIRYNPKTEKIKETLDRVYDLFALRIVVQTTEECYLVENLLSQLWENIPSERDDYIKRPRLTGYEAIHNAFKIEQRLIMEVQIKTFEMHQRAEYGISSHLLYKIGDKGQKSLAVGEFKKYLAKHPEWFKDLNFWELQKKKGYIPNTPFSEKEYVLTPKGGIVELPKGATVVDFAFAVHTSIGEHCIGAFVNNKIVKLDYVVKTGDIVNIKLDKKKRRPSKDWLEFVKTRRARIRIKKLVEQD